MDFFEAIKKRRSIRKFTQDVVPDNVIRKALEAAILAPNSSNIQSWQFYWVRSVGSKQKLVEFCLNQSAARTASHLVVVVADPKLWRRSHKPLIDWVKGANPPKAVHVYYEKMIPLTYTWGLFNIWGRVKGLMGFCIGLFRPMLRGPHTLGQLQEVSIKSAALASENFVLAVTAQGFSSCMMEGFDESRVRRMLRLESSARVVMVIGVGKESERGTWGPQFRLDLETVVKEV